MFKLDKNGKVLSSFKYVYDASGQMIEETQTQQEEIYQRTYQYNKANEIIGFTEEHQGQITKYEYHYDGVGNRTGLTITGPDGTRTIQYTYNSANQLITETEGDKVVHYEYDDNGNLIRKKGPGNQVEYYDYDEENRLVQIVEHQGKGQTFGYDSDGNRLFRTVSGNNGNGNGKGTPNHGIGNGKGQGYDNGKGHDKQKDKELNKPESYEYIRYLNDISVPYPQVLMTADSKGTYRGVYTYGLERISVRDEVSVEGKPNNPLYYLYDGRGSVSQLTNTNGNVRDQYRYEPFGAPMPGGGLEPDTRLLNNPYGYNGEDYDIESNLQYLRARYYNPEIGRFISEDSYLGEIMQPLTLNRYAYTANNPLMYQDPSGHSVVKLGSRGQSVKELQQLLISSGYNGLKADGIFGKGTLAAVRAYQANKGLTVDGIVGSQTWGALRGSTSTNPTLRKGSRGGAVTKLQQGLLRLDYDLGPYGADGVFGDKTKQAVKDFQGKNGLTKDGIVGKQTWAALAAKKVISNNGNNCGNFQYADDGYDDQYDWNQQHKGRGSDAKKERKSKLKMHGGNVVQKKENRTQKICIIAKKVEEMMIIKVGET